MRTLVTLFMLIVMSLPISAASPGPQQAELGKLRDSISAIEASIEKKADDDTGLVKLRVDLDTFSRAVINFGVSLRPRINEIKQRLDALGTPPKEGEPAEAESLALERKLMLEEKGQYNLLLGEAENLSIRSSRAVDRIGSLRRELFASTLFKQTDLDGTVSLETLSGFQREFSKARQQISSRMRFMYAFRSKELVPAILLSILIVLATLLAERRMFGFIRRATPSDTQESYIARLSLAFWSTVIPSLAVAAALAATYWLFSHFGVFTPQTEGLAEAILISVAALYFIQRLASALLSPASTARRLILVSDRAARMLFFLIVSLAIIHVLDFFIGRLNDIFSSPLTLTVSKSLISSLLISAVLVMIALVRPFNDKISGRAYGWPVWVRAPILMMAIFIIAAALFGYIGLARFAAAQIVVTAAILATMYIGVQSGHVLAAEGVFPQSVIGNRIKQKFTLNDTTLDQLGLLFSFIIYAAVFVIGLPLLLLQWGFNQLDIQTWLYRILTDIRIGNISISLIGILLGFAVFVVGFLFTRRVQHWLDGSVMARSRVDIGVRNSIRTIVGYVGIALAAVIGLSAAGFDLSSLALVAGALSLGKIGRAHV